jgi:hypothetical protein
MPGVGASPSDFLLLTFQRSDAVGGGTFSLGTAYVAAASIRFPASS